MSCSPDGKWIALPGWEGGERPGIFITTVDGKEVRLLASLGSGAAALNCDPTWSSDSKTIAYGNKGIYLVDIEGGKPREIMKPSNSLKGHILHRPVFAPDGSSVAYIAQDRENHDRVMMTTIAGQETRQVLSLEDREFHVNIFDLSPDGRYVVFTPGNAEVWCAATDGSEPFKIGDISNVGSNAWAWMPKWSPKGDTITFIVDCEEHQYWVMENILPAR
jgi:Tol biopolymer transport system component